jgi:hypothetical protein
VDIFGLEQLMSYFVLISRNLISDEKPKETPAPVEQPIEEEKTQEPKEKDKAKGKGQRGNFR